VRNLNRPADFLARLLIRPLWVLEATAVAMSYLLYYFMGIELEIISMPRLLVFVPH
jgi:hypothetical protein